MLRIFLILLLLTSCKTAANSTVSASVKISEDETLDLTKYSANDADYKKFRAELGDQYEKTMQHLQSSISQLAQGIPADFNKLTPEEKVAIHHYSSMGYRELNKVLRKSDIEGSAKHAGFIKVLSSALNKLPAVSAVVYRGGMLPTFGNSDYFFPFHNLKTVDPERLGNFKVGQIFIDRGFMSTSLHSADGIRQAFGCREAAYTIRSKYGCEISPLALIPDEREILFVPGSEFKIQKIQNTFPPENKCPNEVVELEVDEVEPSATKLAE